LYCTPTEVKAYLGISATADDALLLSLCERVSRIVDQLADTWFYEQSETRYYDWDNHAYIELDAPLLSAVTVTNDSAAMATVDYRLLPRNGYPKLRLEVMRDGSTILSYTTTRQDATSIAGLWGWHDDYAHAWATDTTLAAAITTTTATSCTVTAATNLQAGQTWKIDSEQIYCSSLSSTTATIERGVNGTTAATHLISASISIWRPALNIREATRQLTCQIYKMKDSLPWGRIEYVDVGTIQMVAGVPELVNRIVSYYRGLRL